MLKDLVDKEQPTVLCLQETKLQNKDSVTQTWAHILVGYKGHFNHCGAKAGYSGTAYV